MCAGPNRCVLPTKSLEFILIFLVVAQQVQDTEIRDPTSDDKFEEEQKKIIGKYVPEARGQRQKQS